MTQDEPGLGTGLGQGGVWFADGCLLVSPRGRAWREEARSLTPLLVRTLIPLVRTPPS